MVSAENKITRHRKKHRKPENQDTPGNVYLYSIKKACYNMGFTIKKTEKT